MFLDVPAGPSNPEGQATRKNLFLESPENPIFLKELRTRKHVFLELLSEVQEAHNSMFLGVAENRSSPYPTKRALNFGKPFKSRSFRNTQQFVL